MSGLPPPHAHPTCYLPQLCVCRVLARQLPLTAPPTANAAPTLAAQPLGPKRLATPHPEPNLAAVEGWLVILTGLHEETQEDDIHDKFCDFGTAFNPNPDPKPRPKPKP